MKPSLYWTFLLCLLFTACASPGPRSPASVEVSCGGLLEGLIQTEGRLYRLSDFPDLESEFIDESIQLRRLVELHHFEEHQEQSRVILALLKRKHPELRADQLARRYLALHRQCD